MQRIECNQSLCSHIQNAIADANLCPGIIRMVISDGKISIERVDDSEYDPPTDNDEIYEAYEYMLENANDDELMNVYETLESELEERGLI